MSQRSKLGLRVAVIGGLAMATALVAACREDYLDRRQGVTIGAGNAMKFNATTQTINPWPRHAHDTRMRHDGVYIGKVIEKYQEGPPKKTVGQSVTTVK
ncbi:MAG: hypothetical protein AAFV26_05265 [Pseudomonadota bacterium]